jgi:drug/metabolite transporter (DMT)-like permease
MTTPVSSIALVTFGSFIGSFSALGLKAGSRRVQNNLRSLLTNWPLAAGIAGYLLSSVFFIIGLKNGELSILFPMVSTGYIWTLVWSRVFFKEPFTRGKFVGLALILAGCVIGLGHPATGLDFRTACCRCKAPAPRGAPWEN